MARESGSEIAKSGFKREDDIINAINDGTYSELIESILKDIGIDTKTAHNLKANKGIRGSKCDIKITFTDRYRGNSYRSIQVKSWRTSLNQVDKRWVDNYQKLWGFDDKLSSLLKRYTGEIAPEPNSYRYRDNRIYFDEMNDGEREMILSFFSRNKKMILTDLLIGRNEKITHILAINRDSNSYITRTAEEYFSIFSSGDVMFTNSRKNTGQNLRIGGITMQRKGGDGGAESAKMLQFKMSPKLLY